jgi:hypothetical protein
MGPITNERSELSKILLVACDQSYWGGPDTNTPDIQKGPITEGTALSSYSDSAGPNAMPSEWNSLGLDQWLVSQRYDDAATGLGATVYGEKKFVRSRERAQPIYFMAADGQVESVEVPSRPDWNTIRLATSVVPGLLFLASGGAPQSLGWHSSFRQA